MKNNFRPAGTLGHFKTFLEDSRKKKSELTLWQVVDQKRKIVKGVIKEIKFDKKENLISVGLSKNTKLDQELPIYIYAEDDGLLFKGEYKFFVNKQINILVHDNVFLKEKRSIFRFPFLYTEVNSQLEIEGNLMSYQLRDVSEKGYCFYIKPSQAKVFKADLPVALNEIHGIKLPKSINGKVVHCSSARSPKGGKRTVVGVKFNRSSKLFAKIQSQLT